jgi:hypothetical protein
VARDAVATRRGFGSPQATSQKREVAHPATWAWLFPELRKADQLTVAELVPK